MLLLGIETSCDETAAAVVRNGREILSNIVFSQMSLHRKTGGVVPEVAAREHAVKIIPVIEEALKKSHQKLSDIDAVAVTRGPGLQISLMVGTNAAQTLALVLRKPLIPVNHIEGHMYATFAKRKFSPKFPIVILTASGGHNELVLWKNHGEYTFLGSTLDDAAGEAFDKGARLLGLPYSGGPAIEELAKDGNPRTYPLPFPFLSPWNPRKGKFNFNFSFSGLKTALFYFLRDFQGRKDQSLRTDLAASFQHSICEVLASKLVFAAKKFHAREVHLGGGVSANSYLKKLVRQKMKALGLSKTPFRFPPLSLCTDNAAMIAIAGFYQYQKKPWLYQRWKPLTPLPNFPVKNWPRKAIIGM